MTRRRKLPVVFCAAVLVAVACTGPDDRDDVDGTLSITATTSTVSIPVATGTPELAAQLTPTAAPSPTPTETPAPTLTETPTPPTPTPEPTPTPTQLPIGLEDSLPVAEELPGSGFFLANQGSRSALELAQSYADSSEHLVRLDSWGFKEHIFREFGRDDTSDGSELPGFVLTTVNEYGSADQAKDALDWLRSWNGSLGHVFVNPDPDLGAAAFASSVLTADGVTTAITYVQIGPRIYAYFAQGGDALEFSVDLATQNTDRIASASDA